MLDVTAFVLEIPPVTRTYIVLCVLTTLSCMLDVISPFSLYLSVDLVFRKVQLWRLLTNFLFFGSSLDLNFFFHMYFLGRYCRRLEEESFAGKTADLVYMVILGALAMLVCAPMLGLSFLGSSLTFMFVYVWGRRNPHLQLQLLGLMNFTAPYLCYVLLALSLLLGHDVTADCLGIVVGHSYYFTKFVYPEMTRPNQVKLLRTPQLLRLFFDSNP